MAEVAGAPSWLPPSVRPPRASHSSNRKATWRPGSALSSGRDTINIQGLCRTHHREWQSGQAEIAAEGGADQRSAKNAARPMNQSREAHRSAWPLHSPEGGRSTSGPGVLTSAATRHSRPNTPAGAGADYAAAPSGEEAGPSALSSARGDGPSNVAQRRPTGYRVEAGRRRRRDRPG